MLEGCYWCMDSLSKDFSEACAHTYGGMHKDRMLSVAEKKEKNPHLLLMEVCMHYGILFAK